MTAPANVLNPGVGAGTWDDVSTSENRGRRWWPFVVAIVVIVLGVSVALPAARHQWNESVIRQSTPYTALSFQSAADLPTKVTSGTEVHLSFLISNHEGRTVPYSYVLTSGNGTATGGATTLLRGSAMVAAGKSRIVSVHVVPKCTSQTCRVRVALPGHAETVDALIRVTSAAK
jgi:hypothetical protein